MIFNRYINQDYPAELARVRKDGRFSGFILYEAGACLRFNDQGECSLQKDVVAEVCRMMKDK